MISGMSGTAVVTGSSSGNGRAIARRLSAGGMSIVCADLSPDARPDGFEEDLDIPTHELIASAGGQATFVKCDVRDRAQVRAVIGTAEQTFGGFDVIVNNAGVFTGLASIFEEEEKNFDLSVAVNIKGVWNGCKEAATHLRSRGKPGRIINIASVGGLVGIPNEPGYCATKGAVVNMTRAVAMDCAPYLIAVNAVCPGFIVTGMVREFVESEEATAAMTEATPWPRFGNPDDVAGAVAFLCAPDSEWMTGVALAVDGGFTAK